MDDDDERQPSKLVSSRELIPRRTWTGVYDDSILCADCEARFGPWDDAAARFFLREQLAEIAGDDGAPLAAVSATADPRQLRLFVLSVLWRASVSSRPECSTVRLLRFENRVRSLLRAKDPGPSERFAVLLQRFEYDRTLIPVVYPHRQRIEGLNCYTFQLAGYLVHAAIDERRFSPELQAVALGDAPPVVALSKAYIGSPQRARMVRVVHAADAAMRARKEARGQRGTP